MLKLGKMHVEDESIPHFWKRYVSVGHFVPSPVMHLDSSWPNQGANYI